MTIKTSDISCPTCKKPNTWQSENKFRPFCSDRCKLIDLGAWADESRRVPGSEIDPQEFEDKSEE